MVDHNLAAYHGVIPSNLQGFEPTWVANNALIGKLYDVANFSFPNLPQEITVVIIESGCRALRCKSWQLDRAVIGHVDNASIGLDDASLHMKNSTSIVVGQTKLTKSERIITHDLDEALKIGDNITILRDGAVVQNGRPQDIVMSPADDYVTDFIKDINKARVLQLDSVMGKERGIKGPSLEANTLLEDAMQAVIDNKANGAVITKNGKKS